MFIATVRFFYQIATYTCIHLPPAAPKRVLSQVSENVLPENSDGVLSQAGWRRILCAVPLMGHCWTPVKLGSKGRTR